MNRLFNYGYYKRNYPMLIRLIINKRGVSHVQIQQIISGGSNTVVFGHKRRLSQKGQGWKEWPQNAKTKEASVKTVVKVGMYDHECMLRLLRAAGSDANWVKKTARILYPNLLTIIEWVRVSACVRAGWKIIIMITLVRFTAPLQTEKKKGGGGGVGGNLNRSTTTTSFMTKPQSSEAKNKLIEADRNRSKCTRKGSKQAS